MLQQVLDAGTWVRTRSKGQGGESGRRLALKKWGPPGTRSPLSLGVSASQARPADGGPETVDRGEGKSGPGGRGGKRKRVPSGLQTAAGDCDWAAAHHPCGSAMQLRVAVAGALAPGAGAAAAGVKRPQDGSSPAQWRAVEYSARGSFCPAGRANPPPAFARESANNTAEAHHNRTWPRTYTVSLRGWAIGPGS